VILGAEIDLLWRSLITDIDKLCERSTADLDQMRGRQGKDQEKRRPGQMIAAAAGCLTAD